MRARARARFLCFVYRARARARKQKKRVIPNSMRFPFGGNAAHARFSPGEMQHMRVSPRQRCNTCEFLPRRNATGAPFSPGKINIYRISPWRNTTISELLLYDSQRSRHSKHHAMSPRENAAHANFSPGGKFNATHARLSRNAPVTGAHPLPGEVHSVSDTYRISPWGKSKNLGIAII